MQGELGRQILKPTNKLEWVPSSNNNNDNKTNLLRGFQFIIQLLVWVMRHIQKSYDKLCVEYCASWILCILYRFSQ